MQIWRLFRMNDKTEDEKPGGSGDKSAANKKAKQYDPLHKVRKFLELLFERFREAYVPNRRIAIDEQVSNHLYIALSSLPVWIRDDVVKIPHFFLKRTVRNYKVFCRWCGLLDDFSGFVW